MALLELVHARPDWMGALGVALTRPPGVPERRGGEDPWSDGRAPTGRGGSPTTSRGCARRSTSPRATACAGWATRRPWRRGSSTSEAEARLDRLRERRVLDAAGFLLHD